MRGLKQLHDEFDLDYDTLSEAVAEVRGLLRGLTYDVDNAILFPDGILFRRKDVEEKTINCEYFALRICSRSMMSGGQPAIPLDVARRLWARMAQLIYAHNEPLFNIVID